MEEHPGTQGLPALGRDAAEIVFLGTGANDN